MTRTNTKVYAEFVGDGTQTDFPAGIYADDAAQIKVEISDPGTFSWSVAGLSDELGVTVTITPAPPDGAEVKIWRETIPTQTIDLSTVSTVTPQQLEDALDSLAEPLQEAWHWAVGPSAELETSVADAANYAAIAEQAASDAQNYAATASSAAADATTQATNAANAAAQADASAAAAAADAANIAANVAAAASSASDAAAMEASAAAHAASASASAASAAADAAAAQASKDAAAASEAAALAAKAAAEASATAAAASEAAALTAKDAAESAKIAAAGSELNALAFANTAAAEADRAEAAADGVDAFANTASTKAAEAAASAAAAQHSEQMAQTYANDAANNAADVAANVTLARDWATKTSATVDGIEYSAKYYAQSIVGDVNTATIKATEAANSAAAAAASAADAANAASAAQASADDAANSVSSAVASETYAATFASNAAASATDAATYASNAAMSASDAASSASTATTQAGIATTKATDAANSAAAAQTAANDAVAARDDVWDRHLGAFSSAPTTKPDGSALTDGVFYWNTTTSTLYVYDLATATWNALDLPQYPGAAGLVGWNGANWISRSIAGGTGIIVADGDGQAGNPTIILDSHTHTLSAISDWPTTVTPIEVGYLAGVTSSIQAQLDSKASDTHTHSWGDVYGTPTTLAGYGITDGVQTTRQIATGPGLTGGGDLSADRTLGVDRVGMLGELNINQTASLAGSGTVTIDRTLGDTFTQTVTGNVTFAFANADTTDYLALFIINGGSYTITWPSNVKWPGGTAPALTASGEDVLVFVTHDGGTTWFGSRSMEAVA